MEDPYLYGKSNSKSKQCTEKVIEDFKHRIQWRSDGKDSVIDVGCGCGDTIAELILPIIPRNFSRLVGIDISHAMVDYAKQNYHHDKITYEVLDFGGDISSFLVLNEPFDHLTSFFSLHWIQGQRKVAENMFKLLQPGGDFLISFIANSGIYDAYQALTKSVKWAGYMKNIEKFVFPYQYSTNAICEETQILQEAGFKNLKANLRVVDFCYENSDEIKRLLHAIDPFINSIPQVMHNDYLSDLLIQYAVGNMKYILKMDIMVVYGQKSCLLS